MDAFLPHNWLNYCSVLAYNQIQIITEDYTRKLENLLEVKTKELLGA